MISLSDAIRLESSNPAVNTFKPWWEVWIDYTINGFLLVVLFALAGVTIAGTPGLQCLPTDNTIYKWNFAVTNYINAKCTTHVDGHLLIVFPYIILAEWLVLFVLHLSWFNLPGAKAFLSSSFDTFQSLKREGILASKAKPERKILKPGSSIRESVKSKSSKDGVVKDDGNDDSDDDGGNESNDVEESPESQRNARLVFLVGWLQYLLQFRYHLVNLYTMKSLATCSFTTIASFSLIYSLAVYRWRVAFTCNLHGYLPPPYDVSSCSFPAAPYVYSMMILNIVFTMLLFIFNLRALFWLAKYRLKYKTYKQKKWQNDHPLRGKPGFYDYFFCVQLMKQHNAEGDIVFETMETAFRLFQNKIPEEEEVAANFPLLVPEMPTFAKNQYILGEILRELGMSLKKSEDGHDDLWVALVNSVHQEKPVLSSKNVPRVVEEIRAQVLAVLLEKHAFFKDLINKDSHCSVFDDYIEDIKKGKVRDGGIIEDHYILMAFAIAYEINVVVMRAQKSSLLYEPEKPETHQTIWFMTFVPPRYYYATSADPGVTAEENAGLKFVTDQIYQSELLKEMNEKWDSVGYKEYKRLVEDRFPLELPYRPGPNQPVSESEPENMEGLRLRLTPSKSVETKVEHFALMENV